MDGLGYAGGCVMAMADGRWQMADRAQLCLVGADCGEIL